ncbi:MAG: TadE/TadG family type IV pilus assembly protein [Erythrobacter sp.]
MIARMLHFTRSLAQDLRGSMVIETAIVAPVLLVLALGGFESSRIVARQAELQTAAAEAAAIVRASPPKTADERTVVHDVVKTSLGLADTDVTVTPLFRCGAEDAFVDAETSCEESATVSYYIEVVITDSYTPMWTSFGVGGPVDYRVERMVFISS